MTNETAPQDNPKPGNHRKLFNRGALVIIVMFAVILILALIGPFWPIYLPWVHYHEKTDLPADLVVAEVRWLDHPIDHYRLVMFRKPEMTGLLPACDQDIEVEREVITKINTDSCSQDSLPSNTIETVVGPPMTVSMLFKLLEHDTTEIRFGRGAQCGDLSVVESSYDPQFGYPTSIQYKWETASPANMGWNTYRQYRGNEPSGEFSCIAVYRPNKGQITITLTALP